MAKKSKSRERKPAGRSTTVDVTRRICNLVPSRGTDKDFTFRDSIAGGAIRAVAAPPFPSTGRSRVSCVDKARNDGTTAASDSDNSFRPQTYLFF